MSTTGVISYLAILGGMVGFAAALMFTLRAVKLI